MIYDIYKDLPKDAIRLGFNKVTFVDNILRLWETYSIEHTPRCKDTLWEIAERIESQTEAKLYYDFFSLFENYRYKFKIDSDFLYSLRLNRDTLLTSQTVFYYVSLLRIYESTNTINSLDINKLPTKEYVDYMVKHLYQYFYPEFNASNYCYNNFNVIVRNKNIKNPTVSYLLNYLPNYITDAINYVDCIGNSCDNYVIYNDIITLWFKEDYNNMIDTSKVNDLIIAIYNSTYKSDELRNFYYKELNIYLTRKYSSSLLLSYLDIDKILKSNDTDLKLFYKDLSKLCFAYDIPIDEYYDEFNKLVESLGTLTNEDIKIITNINDKVLRYGINDVDVNKYSSYETFLVKYANKYYKDYDKVILSCMDNPITNPMEYKGLKDNKHKILVDTIYDFIVRNNNETNYIIFDLEEVLNNLTTIIEYNEGFLCNIFYECFYLNNILSYSTRDAMMRIIDLIKDIYDLIMDNEINVELDTSKFMSNTCLANYIVINNCKYNNLFISLLNLNYRLGKYIYDL